MGIIESQYPKDYQIFTTNYCNKIDKESPLLGFYKIYDHKYVQNK